MSLRSQLTPKTASILSLSCFSDINGYTDSQMFSTRKQFWGPTLYLTEKETRLRYWESCLISKRESVAILKLEAPRPGISQATDIILDKYIHELVKEINSFTLLWNLKFFTLVSKGPRLHIIISYFHTDVFFSGNFFLPKTLKCTPR